MVSVLVKFMAIKLLDGVSRGGKNIKIHILDKEVYKQRNIVEQFFNRIKENRHIAMRFDKLSICFWNFIVVVAIKIKLK